MSIRRVELGFNSSLSWEYEFSLCLQDLSILVTGETGLPCPDLTDRCRSAWNPQKEQAEDQ